MRIKLHEFRFGGRYVLDKELIPTLGTALTTSTRIIGYGKDQEATKIRLTLGSVRQVVQTLPRTLRLLQGPDVCRFH